MHKHLLSIITLALFATASQAQTVSTFDTLHLAGTDTFYVNYTSLGNDVGFHDGHAFFPSYFDTTNFGSSIDSFWDYGFIYSNKADSTTGSYTNECAAKAYKGYGGE